MGRRSAYALALAFVAFACSAEEEVASAESACSVDTCHQPAGAVCLDGACVIGGVYGDCMNNEAGCGASDAAVCLASDPTLFTGFGVCSKPCEDESDCWWALPDAEYPSSCTYLDDFGGSFCVIKCVDGGCPVDMTCRGGICTFDADGCGPSANPDEDNEGYCVCAPEQYWCHPDAQDLECCGGGGGGGGGGGTGCCRTCTTGQPCGNSCIDVDDTCHLPPGCACSG